MTSARAGAFDARGLIALFMDPVLIAALALYGVGPLSGSTRSSMRR